MPTRSGIEGEKKFTSRLDFNATPSAGAFGFEFGVQPSGAGASLAIDSGENALKFFDWPMAQASRVRPQARLEMPVGTTLDFEIYVNGSVAVMYVDNRYALTTRIYGLFGAEWRVFARNANVELSGLTVSRIGPDK